MFGKKEEQHNADMELFTIYDGKTQSYEIPGYAVNQNDMIRQMLNMFRDPKQSENRFLINAEDFSIFSLGTYDKKTGRIMATELRHVANLHDLRSIARPDWSIEQFGRKPAPQQNQMGIVPT